MSVPHPEVRGINCTSQVSSIFTFCLSLSVIILFNFINALLTLFKSHFLKPQFLNVIISSKISKTCVLIRIFETIAKTYNKSRAYNTVNALLVWFKRDKPTNTQHILEFVIVLQLLLCMLLGSPAMETKAPKQIKVDLSVKVFSKGSTWKVCIDVEMFESFRFFSLPHHCLFFRLYYFCFLFYF